MQLVHYTAASMAIALGTRTIPQNGKRYDKPDGLWVSVGDSWRQWSESEEYAPFGSVSREGGLRAAGIRVFEITPSPNAKLLVLATPRDLDAFTREYRESDDRYAAIEWKAVAEAYDGIVIAPYQWSRRHELIWYYSWDCASGCIWNHRAIESAREIEGDEVERADLFAEAVA